MRHRPRERRERQHRTPPATATSAAAFHGARSVTRCPRKVQYAIVGPQHDDDEGRDRAASNVRSTAAPRCHRLAGGGESRHKRARACRERRRGQQRRHGAREQLAFGLRERLEPAPDTIARCGGHPRQQVGRVPTGPRTAPARRSRSTAARRYGTRNGSVTTTVRRPAPVSPASTRRFVQSRRSAIS